MDQLEVKYGLQVLSDGADNYHANVYKITTDETGVWVDWIAQFYDKEVGHAFIRAWNGEETPE